MFKKMFSLSLPLLTVLTIHFQSAAQKSDTIIYVLEVYNRNLYQGFGEGSMKKLAEQTGGRVIDVGSKREKLQAAFETVPLVDPASTMRRARRSPSL